VKEAPCSTAVPAVLPLAPAQLRDENSTPKPKQVIRYLVLSSKDMADIFVGSISPSQRLMGDLTDVAQGGRVVVAFPIPPPGTATPASWLPSARRVPTCQGRGHYWNCRSGFQVFTGFSGGPRNGIVAVVAVHILSCAPTPRRQQMARRATFPPPAGPLLRAVAIWA
jgi:hypothetical protein